MDTTTISSPLVRAWGLVADLAACGRDITAIPSDTDFAGRVVELINARLSCPWGLFLLQTSAPTPVVVSWGLDGEQEQRLIRQNGNRAHSDAFEILLHYNNTPAGKLLIGSNPELEAIC